MKEPDLKKYLNKYKGTAVDFFRFPGNYGDSLIWHGTKRLISSLNISEHYVDITSPKHNNILFIDGGGNLVDYYSDISDFLLEKPDLYNEIVILPHTIFGAKQIKVLNGISSKLVVFCREKISAKFILLVFRYIRVFHAVGKLFAFFRAFARFAKHGFIRDLGQVFDLGQGAVSFSHDRGGQITGISLSDMQYGTWTHCFICHSI